MKKRTGLPPLAPSQQHHASASSDAPPSASPSLHAFPRVASPSGLSFLTKPSKWFTRSPSSLKTPEPGDVKPRPSFSSSRKPVISQPTDPRPLLEVPSPASPLAASQSFHDLTLPRPQDPLYSLGSAPGWPSASDATADTGSGSLATISRRTWSKSVDDLSSFSSPTTESSDMAGRIHAYKASSTVAAIVPLPADTPTRPLLTSANTVPPSIKFPTIKTTPPQSIPENIITNPPRRRSHSHTTILNSSLLPGSKPSPTVDKFGKGGFFGVASKALSPHTPSSDESNRTSQIVHQSGFLNRHPFSSSSDGPGLSRGWKPTKAVLKGTKLFFYKPPADRIHDIKELFPTGIVIEEAVSPPSPPELLRPTRKDSDAPRKRVYWGRDQHPELVINKETRLIEKGSIDALLHQAVFGTFFFSLEPTASVDPQEAWSTFASTVCICLPHRSFMGRVRFESELRRYISYLLDGANDEEVSTLTERVLRLARMYVELWGDPVNSEEWRAWEVETFKQPQLVFDRPMTPPSNPSTFPLPASPLPSTPFSIGNHSTPPASPISPSRGDKGRQAAKARSQARLWAILEREGLTREIFSRLDVDKVAYSLRMFHRSSDVRKTLLSSLARAGELLDAIEAQFSSPASKAHHQLSSSREENDARRGASSSFAGGLDVFCGSDARPHWLTRLVISQLLGAGYSAGSFDEDRGGSTSSALAQLSRTHARAEGLGRWIAVGERARVTGDECTWMAIRTAVCSKALARLDKVWRRVDEQQRKTVEAWVTDTASTPPQVTVVPWLGDAAEQAWNALEQARMDKDNAPTFESMSEVETRVLRLRDRLRDMLTASTILDDEEPEGEAAALVKFWAHTSSEVITKPSHIDRNLSLSFAAEPRQKNQFAPFFWKPPVPSPTHVLLPLLFIQPLPTLSFFDQETLLQNKNNPTEQTSDSALGGLTEAQFRRVLGLPALPSSSTSRASSRPADSRRQSVDMNSFGTTSHTGQDRELGDTFMYAFDGELILKILPQPRLQSRSPHRRRPPSSVTTDSMINDTSSSSTLPLNSGGASLERRPSQTPSVRAAIASPLERRPSAIRPSRRSSLPSLSRAPSLLVPDRDPTPEPSLRVAVSGGTLERLVEVLLSGLKVSVAATDDVGLSTGKMRVFAVDHAEFTKQWWSMFRSYVSPFVFFELLKKRYRTNLRGSSHDGSDEVVDSPAGPQSNRCLRVLAVMKDWLIRGGGATDVLDDLQLYESFHSFVDGLQDLSNETAPDMIEADNWHRALKLAFRCQTQRPDLSTSSEVPRRGGLSRSFGASAPAIDSIDAEELVSNLDAIASTVLAAVSEDDLVNTLDILEVQTMDRTAWFLPRDPPMSGDDMSIQNIYSIIQHLEPTPLVPELGSHDALHKTFPPAVRMLFRAQAVIRKWVITKITAPRVGLRAREERIQLILRAIEVCRIRSVPIPEDRTMEIPSNPTLQTCARSFVETALTAAVCGPESRAYVKAWQNVAAARKMPLDSLVSLLSSPTIEPASYSPPITIDGGWILERLLELVSLPDTFTSGAGDHILINFDKRRYISTLIGSLPQFLTQGPNHANDRVDIERMNNMLREVVQAGTDMRALREDAFRESQSSPSYATKRQVRPFQSLLSTQLEKLRRDRQVRDKLSKERKLEQQRSERRENDLYKAMHLQKRPNPLATPKHDRHKRSMSAFFRVVRPLSTAFSSQSTPLASGGEARQRTVSELDFTPSGKPALVLSLIEAKVTAFPNDERSFTFQLVTDDGGKWLLQARSDSELESWMNAITRTVAKRLTYVGQGIKPQFNDMVDISPGGPTTHPNAVFGVSLETLVQRENPSSTDEYIPRALEQCLLEVERRGLTEVGIYRISGATSAINAIRNTYNEGSTPDFDCDARFADIHGICSAVKLMLRQLPEPVIPFSLYQQAIECGRITDYDERFSTIRDIVHSMNRVHFVCLRRVVEHLDRVTDYEESNQMTAEALSICFSPSLLQPPPSPSSFALGIGNMAPAMTFVKSLILQFHRIFDDDPDALAEDADAEAILYEEDDELNIEDVSEDGAGSSLLHSSINIPTIFSEADILPSDPTTQSP